MFSIRSKLVRNRLNLFERSSSIRVNTNHVPIFKMRLLQQLENSFFLRAKSTASLFIHYALNGSVQHVFRVLLANTKDLLIIYFYFVPTLISCV